MIGKRVRTKIQSQGELPLVGPDNLWNRKNNAEGKVIPDTLSGDTILGCRGRDAYWVQHDSGTVGAYWAEELETIN